MIDDDFEGSQVRETVRRLVGEAGLSAVSDEARSFWTRSFDGWWVEVSADNDLDGDPAAAVWSAAAVSETGSRITLSRTLSLDEAIAAALRLPPPLRGSSMNERYDTVAEALGVDGVVRSWADGRR